MKLVLGMILAAALTGCVRTPCGIMKANGWSCNLEIVDPLKPGQLVYVERGTFQPLPIKVPDPSCAESNAVREFGTSSWNLGLSAGLPQIPGLSAIADASASIKANGGKDVDITFPTVSICSMPTADGDGTALEQIARAKEIARKYLDALTPEESARIASSGQRKVFLVMQTMEATVDATVHSTSGFSADVSATVKGVKAQVSGGHKGDRTLVFKYDKPLPIGYRALPIVIESGRNEGLLSVGGMKVGDAFESVRAD